MTVGLATVRRSSMSVAHDSSAPVAQYLGAIDICRGGSFRAPETGVGHDSDDREVDSDSGLRHGGCLVATASAASRKAGCLPDPCQGLCGERVDLFGRWSLIPPALHSFGHDRMTGGVLGLGYPLSGVGVGDGGPGQIDGGQSFAPAARWPRYKATL